MKFKQIAAIALLLLVCDSGYFIERKDFIHLISIYACAFAIYFYVLRSTQTEKDIDYWIKISLILRGVLLFSLPQFSEDVYRFIWDGRLIHLGINPFNFKPSYFVDNQLFTEVLTPELFSKLNSKEYFTVYPSVCQGIFTFSVALFPKSIFGSIVVIKAFILAGEVGTIFLMKKILPASQKILMYALNPLIIIELCGNVHFEALMIFFLLLSILLLSKIWNHSRNVEIAFLTSSKNQTFLLLKSSIALALSIATKMLPLMLLPFFIKRLGLKRSFIYFLMVGSATLLLFLPLFNAVFIGNIKSSLSLYFQKFEFNASLYYLLREVGIYLKGYNPISEIAPIMTSLVLIGILLLMIVDFFKKNTNPQDSQTALWTEKDNIFPTFLFALSIYFLCATTVHPWYAALPLALSVFTRFTYIMVWTSLLPLTYIHYSYPKPTENYIVIFLEYALVLSFAIYEIFFKNRVTRSKSDF